MKPNMMTHIIKYICAFVLAALSLSAHAGKVIVHNQAHYLVSFEIESSYGKQIYHSGNFGLGETREKEYKFGNRLRLNWNLRLFVWYSQEIFTFDQSDLDYELFFWGDIGHPKLGIREWRASNPPRIIRARIDRHHEECRDFSCVGLFLYESDWWDGYKP